MQNIAHRRSEKSLSGIRCIHTHPNAEGILSEVDKSALLRLKFDAMIAVGVFEEISSIYVGFADIDSEGTHDSVEYGPYSLENINTNFSIKSILDIEQMLKNKKLEKDDSVEKAIIVGLHLSNDRESKLEDSEKSLCELKELAKAAGAKVVYKYLQTKKNKDTAFLIGKGLLDELNLLIQVYDVSILIFDEELSGAQVRNIEEVVGIKVIDRTGLILDIFAQRAKSREGKLQVELAQLNYRLPRLIGLGNQLSRLGGGIGTRGPGEKKLEVDKRHIRRRITFLEHELSNISIRRENLRENRKKNNYPSVALVGYTNSGKSTLLNKLCKSNVEAKDQLFMTLDTTTRMIDYKGINILLSDTVGFIRKLPHQLIDAFKSTLEEVLYSDLLLLVIDISDSDSYKHFEVVNEILKELDIKDKPIITIFNKTDKVKNEVIFPKHNLKNELVEISAINGNGIENLLDKIYNVLSQDYIEESLLLPYSKGKDLAYIYENAKIINRMDLEEGIFVKVRISSRYLENIRKYKVEELNKG